MGNHDKTAGKADIYKIETMSGKILGMISLIIGIVGAALLTVGMATSYWSQDGSGVWNGCSVNVCLAVQVMILISTVFGIIHALILLLHVIQQVGPNTQNILITACMSAALAVSFGYVSIMKYDHKSEDGRWVDLGWSFVLTCVGISIILINIFVIMKERSNQRAAGAYSSI